jgi:pimeloyl-ACP methyl ester carboxylesterase
VTQPQAIYFRDRRVVDGRETTCRITPGETTPALLLVHGAGGSSRHWRFQLRDLGQTRRIVAIDLPGHGASVGPNLTSVEAMADFVEAVRVAYGLGPVIIGGHSMGGRVAQAFALNHPAACVGLCVMASGALMRVAPPVLKAIEEQFGVLPQMMNVTGFAKSTPEDIKAELIGPTGADCLQNVLVDDLRAAISSDFSARLHEIRVPTVIVSGAEDRLTPPHYQRFLAEHIAGAELITLESTGHYVQVERPAEVSAALTRLLERVG